LIPCLGTFIFCLAIKLEIGIIVGIGINILFILYQAARPKISMERLFVSTAAICGYAIKSKSQLLFISSALVAERISQDGSIEIKSIDIKSRL
jgi:MFS superfamily sulfate permease-like transporter